MTRDDTFETVWELERRVWDAVVEKNGGTLHDLFADDYVEITLTGNRIEKDEIVKQSPVIDEINRYDIDAQRTIPLDTITVLLSYHLNLDGKCRGVAISPKERWVASIWSKIDGRWLCRFFQQSPYNSH